MCEPIIDLDLFDIRSYVMYIRIEVHDLVFIKRWPYIQTEIECKGHGLSVDTEAIPELLFLFLLQNADDAVYMHAVTAITQWRSLQKHSQSPTSRP